MSSAILNSVTLLFTYHASKIKEDNVQCCHNDISVLEGNLSIYV